MASRGASPQAEPRISAPPRTDEVIAPERLEAFHRYTRTHGVNMPLYVAARCLLLPFFWIWLRYRRLGRESARVEGGLIVAANHRSFLDPFVIGGLLPFRRPMHYVAKVELFESRLKGWLISRLGAFPIRRGQSDEMAMASARAIVERGGAVCIFPEGTRHRQGGLGKPKRGVGRLALETGATVLPVAVIGSEHVRRGWRIRPRQVRVRAGRATSFPRGASPSPQLAVTVTERIWSSVELMWEWLGGTPPLRTAAVIGAGSWGTAIAVLLARGGLEVTLGTRSEDKAREIERRRENRRYLPGVSLPSRVRVERVADIELGGKDLICLAVPSRDLPQAIASIGDRVGERSALLLLSKGLVPPGAWLPSIYVGERVRSRALASLGGPAHAGEATAGTAALVLGTTDLDLRVQLGRVFDDAGLICERTSDVVGVEIAGAAKNAAALAAAAAEPHGLNAAGIAAARVWRECAEWSARSGGEAETLSGLAGVGDLTATVLAPGSRNRRAGELLGRGVAAEDVPARIGQASEGLDAVPLIAEAVEASGIEAPGLAGLAALIAGEIDAGEWVAGLRRAERGREAA